MHLYGYTIYMKTESVINKKNFNDAGNNMLYFLQFVPYFLLLLYKLVSMLNYANTISNYPVPIIFSSFFNVFDLSHCLGGHYFLHNRIDSSDY